MKAFYWLLHFRYQLPEPLHDPVQIHPGIFVFANSIKDNRTMRASGIRAADMEMVLSSFCLATNLNALISGSREFMQRAGSPIMLRTSVLIEFAAVIL